MKRATPFIVGLALAGLLAAGAFALQMTLQSPTAGDTLAVRVITRLEQIRSVRSDESLSWLKSVKAICTSHETNERVLLSDGRRLLVAGTRVWLTGGLWRRPLLVAAEADLAGCPQLLADKLNARLLAGKQVIEAPIRINGRRAYRLRVSNQPPIIELIVSPATLMPLAIRFSSRRLSGHSRLLSVALSRT